MVLPERYVHTLETLYERAGPVIRYRLDSEISGKSNCSLSEYYSTANADIEYWLSVHQKDRIHGKDDDCFENVASKLLDFGFSKMDARFTAIIEYLLADSYWTGSEATRLTLYPFLLRAGYQNHAQVFSYFNSRIDKIINTIQTYGYSFQDTKSARSAAYENEFRFLNDCWEEPLPTIYDIYAFAYYDKTDSSINEKIESIIQYVLHPDFQKIPERAYMYDSKTKRYYAAGNAFHACLNDDRKLLNIILYSHFAAIETSETLMNDISSLLNTRRENSLYQFDKGLIREQKNKYHMYSGAHMGLAENRSKKDTHEIESSFYMLSLLSNLSVNGICLESV